MSRYIDADAFIGWARTRYCKDCDKRKGMKNGKMRFCYDIGAAPCRACDVEDMIDDVDNFPDADDIDIPIYDKETRVENCTVQILENTKTGRISVGWWRNETNT